MRQITIYVEDELETKIRVAAKAMHLSQRTWITKVIQERVQGEWPTSVKQLSGAWKDFPLVEDLRQAEHADSQREVL